MRLIARLSGTRYVTRTCWSVRLILLALIPVLTLQGQAMAQGTGAPYVVEMGERGPEYYFEPKLLTVPAGTVTIAFNNVGARRHNWVVKLPSGDQRTPDVNAGQTYQQAFTFPQAGTFDVLCDLPTHAQRGMVMQLTVTGAPSAGAPQVPAPAVQVPGATGTTGTTGTTGSTGVPNAPRITDAQSAAPATAPQTQPASPAGGWPLLVSLAIHIPASITWLGIVLYDAIVVAVPFLTAAQRGSLLWRPRWIILATIPLFMATGIYQMIYNPFGTITTYAELSELRETSTYGLALFWKHVFVLASMAATLAVTFWFAPRLIARADVAVPSTAAGAAGTAMSSRVPSLMAWANVAACLALLTCVAVMVYQLH